MIDLLTGREAQRLVLCCIFFYILNCMGLGWRDELWWCMFAILVLIEHLNWHRGREDGVWMTLNMTDAALERIRKQMKEEEEK